MATLQQRKVIREAVEKWQKPNLRGRTALLELLNYTSSNEWEEQPEASEVIWGFLDLMSGLGNEFDAFRTEVVTAVSAAYPPGP
jgi:hypothetical protein